jgi:hypothetical protein
MAMENITEVIQQPTAQEKDELKSYSENVAKWSDSLYIQLSTRINWLLDRYAFQSFDNTDTPIAVDSGISFYLVDTTSGDVTANLPSASENTGIMFHFKNTGTGTLTVDAAELIDNCDTIELIEMETITVVSDGSVYWIVP